jgi:hypothetical protein
MTVVLQFDARTLSHADISVSAKSQGHLNDPRLSARKSGVRSGSKAENLNASKTLPLCPRKRTSPGRSIPRVIQKPTDVPLAEFKLALIQPPAKQLVPEP